MKVTSGLLIVLAMFVMAAHADEPSESSEQEPVAVVPTTVDELVALDGTLAAKARAALDRAQELAKLGDAAAAAATMVEGRRYVTQLKEIYERYLDEHPDDARAHNLFGNVCYDLVGDHPRALALWEKAVELDPTYADAHNNVGTYWLHYGKPGRAMDRFRRAVELDGTSPDYHFNLGQAYYLFRDIAQEKYGWSLEEVYQHALEESRRGSELKPNDFELARDYAMTFLGAESFGVTPDWAKARAAWKRCRALAENNERLFTILLYMARVELRAGSPADARKYAEEALVLRPGNAVAQRLIELSGAGEKTDTPTTGGLER